MLRFKGIVILVYLFVLCGFAHAQNTLLWKIEKKGHKTSYIYGTIHVKDKRVYYLNDSLLSKIKQADVLVTELDFSADNMRKMGEAFLLPQGSTWEDIMTTNQYARFVDFAEKNVAINRSVLEKMKPIVVLFLVMKQDASNEMKDPLDLFLFNYATEQGVQTQGLETIKEQITALDMLSIEDMLDAMDGMDDELPSQMEKLLSAYQKADLEQLGHLIKTEKGMNKAFLKALFDDRNKVMVSRIPGIMKAYSAVFAVGAGHLTGKTGLISGLRKEGFKVTPMMAGTSFPEKDLQKEVGESAFGKVFIVEVPSGYVHDLKKASDMEIHAFTNQNAENASVKSYNTIYYQLSDLQQYDEEQTELFFSAFKEGILSTLNGEIVKETKVNVANGVASEIEMKLGDKQMLALKVMVIEDFCLVLQVVSLGELDYSKVNAFYNSLKIIK